MEIKKGHNLNIFLVDDDPDDRLFFKEAIAEIKADINLNIVNNGEALMNLLLKPDAILPNIIFLDLNMPSKNGFECLEEIKSDKRLMDIIVIIYSTSSSNTEINETYKKGANLYIRKPINFSELKEMLTRILAINWEKYTPKPKKEKFIWAKEI